MDKKKIGFIGLGAMGKPMAGNLIRAGYALTVFDVNPRPMEALAAQGARTAADSAAVARAAEVVITILPEGEHVKAAILGENGVLAGAREGTVLIDMSSIAPHTSRQVAAEALARGLRFMDAPVSGGTTGAEQGTLTIMVGGDEALLEAHRPLLEAMGKTIYHVGEIGMGETVKMINQVLVGINMLGIAEAFALGTKLGADPEVLFKVIRASAGNSFLLDHRVPKYIFKGNFTQPGFALKLLMKDVGLAVDSARLNKMPLFLAGEAFQLLALAAGSGLADKDMSAVIELWEKAAGVQVRAG